MKILLAGDSWGCGVWAKNKKNETPTVIHRGIEQFMSDDGHEVVNISQGGFANYEIINKMKSVINDNFDYIFYIQTDPLRDHFKSSIFQKKEIWFTDYQSLLEINNKLMLDTYNKLNNFGKTIHMIGGCSKVESNMLEQFSNLKLVLCSIPEFICDGYTAPKIFFTQKWWRDELDDRWSLETLDKIIEQQDKWHWLGKNCSHFKEDRYHSDRHGYEKVYNYIKENVLNEQNKGS